MSNPSIAKKRAARLICMQYDYLRLMKTDSEAPLNYLNRLKLEWRTANDKENPLETILEDEETGEEYEMIPEAEPDWRFAKQLISGFAEEEAVVANEVSVLLADKRSLERVSPLLKAIIRHAVYELHYYPERKPAIILDEYVSLTARFFGNPELGFVNGVLQEYAKGKEAKAQA